MQGMFFKERKKKKFIKIVQIFKNYLRLIKEIKHRLDEKIKENRIDIIGK